MNSRLQFEKYVVPFFFFFQTDNPLIHPNSLPHISLIKLQKHFWHNSVQFPLQTAFSWFPFFNESTPVRSSSMRLLNIKQKIPNMKLWHHSSLLDFCQMHTDGICSMRASYRVKAERGSGHSASSLLLRLHTFNYSDVVRHAATGTNIILPPFYLPDSAVINTTFGNNPRKRGVQGI